MALGKRFARSRSAADSSWIGIPLSLWKETVVLFGDWRRRIRLTILEDFCKAKYGQDLFFDTRTLIDAHGCLLAGLDWRPGCRESALGYPGLRPSPGAHGGYLRRSPQLVA